MLTPRHISVKLFKLEKNILILEDSGICDQIIYKGKIIRLISDFSKNLCKGRHKFSKNWKCEPRFYIQSSCPSVQNTIIEKQLQTYNLDNYVPMNHSWSSTNEWASLNKRWQKNFSKIKLWYLLYLIVAFRLNQQ